MYACYGGNDKFQAKLFWIMVMNFSIMNLHESMRLL